MKIYSLLKEFCEKYPQGAMKSIDDLSEDFSLVSQRKRFDAFDIKGGFESFNEYLEGYAQYKIEYRNDPKQLDHSVLMEQAKQHIVNPPDKNKWFKESKVLYSDIPSLITDYIEGVKLSTEKVESLKRMMVESDIDNESIAGINDLTDTFTDHLQESFESFMDKLLWASGYNSRQALMAKKTSSKDITPVFL